MNQTMIAAVDLISKDLRRLLVNASYWAIGIDHLISEENIVEIVGEYNNAWVWGIQKRINSFRS